MSEFDKEAERERLREKFARDEEKRADTQRMSELLLKGATMTNRHCDTCGDPIFRHDGREFCPTCQSRAAATAGDEADATTGSETTVADAEAAPETAQTPETQSAGQAEEATNGRAASPVRRAGEDGRDAEPTTPEASVETPETPSPNSAGGTLGDARASLARTLSNHAAAAERADDPRVAKDHLAAAREAAETLRALDGR